VLYLFGAFLVLTGIKLFRAGTASMDLEKNPALNWVRRHMPTTHHYDGQNFFTLENGRRVATPLLLALVAVEVTDLVFAVDSIPAIFAITQDPFLVYTSNIFAILGLRSLYFVLEGVVQRFAYLKYGLALVLVFVGGKMLAADFFKVPPAASLAVIVALLGGSLAFSVLRRAREKKPDQLPDAAA
jgi:tellurite resistance protein TerC